jgi:RNA polymerase sigma-70 factor (ECF subfamily)
MMDLRKLSDPELIERFREGDSKSFEILLERYQKKLFAYIFFSVKKKETAEDIFQDTCVKAITSLAEGRYSESGRFLPWLTRIAHNLIIDMFRQEKQLDVSSTDNFNFPVLNSTRYAENTVEENMVQRQIYAEVRRLVDYLPPEQKEVILLRHYGEMSYKEIAAYTNVSINTALGRMRYGLINMRRLIKEKKLQLTM